MKATLMTMDGNKYEITNKPNQSTSFDNGNMNVLHQMKNNSNVRNIDHEVQT